MIESTAARVGVSAAMDLLTHNPDIRSLLIEIAKRNQADHLPGQKEVAELLGWDPGNLNREVQKLEKLALVQRIPRGRSKALKVSEHCIDLLDQVQFDWRLEAAFNPSSAVPVTATNASKKDSAKGSAENKAKPGVAIGANACETSTK